MDPAEAARARIERDHGGTLAAVGACADAVAAGWPDGIAGEPVRAPLAAALADAGVLEAAPALLADAVDATGHVLRARPVPAPPYVVVTSRGPLFRATIEPGRLVIGLEAFEAVREPAVGYRRLEGVEPTVTLEPGR